jgi:hypothetical protein
MLCAERPKSISFNEIALAKAIRSAILARRPDKTQSKRIALAQYQVPIAKTDALAERLSVIYKSGRIRYNVIR